MSAFLLFFSGNEFTGAADPGVFCGYLRSLLLRQWMSAHTEAVTNGCFERICFSGDRSYQASYLLVLFLSDPAIGHREHYDQCDGAAQFHFGFASDEVFLKPERFVKSAVDTFDGTAFFILCFPLVTAACKRCEDSAITVDVNADIVADAAFVFAFAFESVMFGRTTILQC